MRPRDRRHDREAEPGAALGPRARVVGAREAVEDALDRFRRHAAAAVAYLDHELAILGGRAQLDRLPRLCVLDGVLEQCVESRPQALLVGEQPPWRERAESPAAIRHVRPADEDVLEEALHLDWLPADEVGTLGLGQQEQTGDDPLDPPEPVYRLVQSVRFRSL